MQLVYFLAPGLAGLINGIVYVLLVKKCPKIGTQFIVPMVYGLYFLFTGSVYVFVFFAILAAANELIMLGGGYQSRIRPAIPHALTWMLNAMGSTLTMLLFRDSLVQSYVAMGDGRRQCGRGHRVSGRVLAGSAEHRRRPGCRRSFVHCRICAGHENAGQTLQARRSCVMEKRKQGRFRPDPRTWLLLCLLGTASVLLVRSESGGACLFLGVPAGPSSVGKRGAGSFLTRCITLFFMPSAGRAYGCWMAAWPFP